MSLLKEDYEDVEGVWISLMWTKETTGLHLEEFLYIIDQIRENPSIRLREANHNAMFEWSLK